MRALVLLLSLATSLTHCERHEPARAEHASAKAGTGARRSVDPTLTGGASRGESRVVSPPPSPLTFSKAKRELRMLYRQGEHHTLYGDCSFVDWRVAWERCCFDPVAKSRRRLEWEHVVPAAALGRALPSWRRGDPSCVDSRGKPFRGRRCARRASEVFRHMEGDMHNLFPTIGVLNEARAAHAVGLIDGEPRAYGSCDFEVAQGARARRGVAQGKVEPRPAARGEIARAYLYMDAAYPQARLVDRPLRRLLLRWHRADPVDDWERRRNDFVAARQGNRNPWISER